MNLMLQLHEFFFRLSNSVYYFQCIIKISVLFSLTFFFVILFRIFIFFYVCLANANKFWFLRYIHSVQQYITSSLSKIYPCTLRCFAYSFSHSLALSRAVSFSCSVCVCMWTVLIRFARLLSLALTLSVCTTVCDEIVVSVCHPSIHPHVWFYTLTVWHKWVLVQRFSISNGSNIYWKQTTYGMWMNANFWRADAAYNLALFGIWWCSFFFELSAIL